MIIAIFLTLFPSLRHPQIHALNKRKTAIGSGWGIGLIQYDIKLKKYE